MEIASEGSDHDLSKDSNINAESAAFSIAKAVDRIDQMGCIDLFPDCSFPFLPPELSSLSAATVDDSTCTENSLTLDVTPQDLQPDPQPTKAENMESEQSVELDESNQNSAKPSEIQLSNRDVDNKLSNKSDEQIISNEKVEKEYSNVIREKLSDEKWEKLSDEKGGEKLSDENGGKKLSNEKDKKKLSCEKSNNKYSKINNKNKISNEINESENHDNCEQIKEKDTKSVEEGIECGLTLKECDSAEINKGQAKDFKDLTHVGTDTGRFFGI